jgi:heptosyltransferase-1
LRAAGNAPISAARPYALLLTMTSRDDKLWAEEHWRSLGGWLQERGIECVLPWGTEEERLRCSRVASALAGAVVPPRMSLPELACLAQGARCVVGVDTGLAHLAAAMNVPVVGLYCGSDPALTGLHGNGRVRNLGGPGHPPAVSEVTSALESLH